jgi:hypothetical protein
MVLVVVGSSSGSSSSFKKSPFFYDLTKIGGKLWNHQVNIKNNQPKKYCQHENMTQKIKGQLGLFSI